MGKYYRLCEIQKESVNGIVIIYTRLHIAFRAQNINSYLDKLNTESITDRNVVREDFMTADSGPDIQNRLIEKNNHRINPNVMRDKSTIFTDS